MSAYKTKYTVPNLRSDWTETTRRGLSVREKGLIIWHHITVPNLYQTCFSWSWWNGEGSKSHWIHFLTHGLSLFGSSWMKDHIHMAAGFDPEHFNAASSLATHNYKQTKASPAGCQIFVVYYLVLSCVRQKAGLFSHWLIFQLEIICTR